MASYFSFLFYGSSSNRQMAYLFLCLAQFCVPSTRWDALDLKGDYQQCGGDDSTADPSPKQQVLWHRSGTFIYPPRLENIRASCL